MKYKGLGLVWTTPSSLSALAAAAKDLNRERPREVGNLGVSSQTYGLFIFSYSCGFILGPAFVGIIKAKADWSVATLALASVCAATCVPIVGLMLYNPPISYSPNYLKILKTSSPPRRKATTLGKPRSYDALADPDS